MKKAFQVAYLFKYLVKSTHWRGHGVHSPFMYDFVRNTLMKAKKGTDASMYHKAFYLNASKKVRRSSYGSKPSQQIVGTKKLFNKISISPKYGKLLSKIVANYEPASILELGSGLGISSYYLAKGSSNSHIITVEGMKEYCDFARATFEYLNISNIQCINKDFDHFFESLDEEKFDMIFIDGSHTYNDTLRYFNLALKHTSESAFIILDDIRWSKGMYMAWSDVCKHPQVRVSVDLGRFGLIFLNPELQKQEYTIRY